MEPETTEIKIIGFLKACKKTYLSGESMANSIGVSRTAVWKHIKSLREAGYPIEGTAKMGYRLLKSAKPFNAFEIALALKKQKNKTIGRKIHFLTSLDSTNTKALELAKNGAPEGTVVISDSQGKGRGRLGRRWVSPSGKNLYTSIILRPPVPPEKAQTLTLLSAVAAAETIEAFIPQKPHLKWPNDILIEGKKVCGILTEMSSETDRINHVVVGIGVNINMDMKKTPSEIKGIATSVAQQRGSRVSRADFAALLYSNFEKWYKKFIKEGPPPVFEAWRGYFQGEGKPIKVKGFSKSITGICLGIDNEGALIVREKTGNIERVVSGDVE